MEIIPNDIREALKWYETKLNECREINKNCIQNGYEPLGGIVNLMLNYSKNIRHLKNRMIEEIKEIDR